MKKSELARQYFMNGCNCAQSVVLAFAPDFGVDEKTALLLSAGLGGGVGRLREICGTISGAAVILGLARGSENPLDQEKKAALYADVQKIAEQFREQNGSYICRELLGLPAGKDQPTPQKRTGAYYAARPCADLVACTAELLEQELTEKYGKNS